MEMDDLRRCRGTISGTVRKANHTANGWFFVFLEIIVDEPEDQ